MAEIQPVDRHGSETKARKRYEMPRLYFFHRKYFLICQS